MDRCLRGTDPGRSARSRAAYTSVISRSPTPERASCSLYPDLHGGPEDSPLPGCSMRVHAGPPRPPSIATVKPERVTSLSFCKSESRVSDPSASSGHPPVPRRWELSLSKMFEMFIHCGRPDPHALGDGRVARPSAIRRAPPLPRRQGLRGSVRRSTRSCQPPRDHLPPPTMSEVPRQGVQRGHPVFEQVAHAASTVGQQHVRVRELDVGRQHQHPERRLGRPRLDRRSQTVVAHPGRHPDIDDGHIRPVLGDRLEERRRIRHRRHHLAVRLAQ